MAGRHAKAKAIEKAKREFGQRFTVAGIIENRGNTYIYEVVPEQEEADEDPAK